MSQHITTDKICSSVSGCIESGLIDVNNDTSVVFYHFDHINEKINQLKSAFPGNTIHTSAIKANPLLKILSELEKTGLGAEVASEGELSLAQKAGFQNEKIVFDSPAKTIFELEFALNNNIHVNADSLCELDRINNILTHLKSNSNVGLRINPQVGYGKIKSTSLAGEYSKFGVPVKSHRQEIIDNFVKYNWLNGIHMHIGSQGCEMTMLLNGIREGLKLINEINRSISPQKRKLSFVDIGGGLPISYHHNQDPPDITKYGNLVQQLLKEYDLNDLQIITEFGRYLHANSGFILSKVEYVKHYGDYNTIIIHSGADILLRECLNPEHWHHEISLLNNKGELKQHGENRKYHIAGPLCFANDIVARNVKLPVAEEGDYIVIHDTGGYTFSMWSKYVSRLFPKIIGVQQNKFEILKQRESLDRITEFWSL